MTNIKRIIGLVAFILIIVGIMAFFSNLPSTGRSITGKTIGDSIESFALSVGLDPGEINPPLDNWLTIAEKSNKGGAI